MKAASATWHSIILWEKCTWKQTALQLECDNLPPHIPQINSELIICTSDTLWKQLCRLTFQNKGHYVNVRWEQIEQTENLGNCLRFWYKKHISKGEKFVTCWTFHASWVESPCKWETYGNGSVCVPPHGKFWHWLKSNTLDSFTQYEGYNSQHHTLCTTISSTAPTLNPIIPAAIAPHSLSLHLALYSQFAFPTSTASYITI